MTVPNEDLIALTNRITDLEEKLAMYEINGLRDSFTGTGQQRFGGNAGRLDKTGIQLVLASNNLGSQLAWVKDGFKINPLVNYPNVRVLGYMIGADAQWLAEITDNASRNSYAQFNLSMSSSLPYAAMYLHDVNVGDCTVQFYVADSANDTAGRFELVSAVLALDNFTSDPFLTAMTDGCLWYRSDTDRPRMRANGITRNLTMDGTNTTLTIATGAVTITTAFHAIDTEAAAATDDLDTINGGETGQVLFLHAANGARDVVAKDGTGNLKLAGDFTLNNVEDTLTLIYDGANWLEIARSDNGA